MDGITFDSIGEMTRYAQLKQLLRAGLVRKLRTQVKFPLELPGGVPILIKSAGFPRGRRAIYTADFVYEQFQKTCWAEVIEEYKGHDDEAARLRRAVVEALYGVSITVTGPGRR